MSGLGTRLGNKLNGVFVRVGVLEKIVVLLCVGGVEAEWDGGAAGEPFISSFLSLPNQNPTWVGIGAVCFVCGEVLLI